MWNTMIYENKNNLKWVKGMKSQPTPNENDVKIRCYNLVWDDELKDRGFVNKDWDRHSPKEFIIEGFGVEEEYTKDDIREILMGNETFPFGFEGKTLPTFLTDFDYEEIV